MKNHKEYLLHLARRSRRKVPYEIDQEHPESEDEIKFFEYQDIGQQFIRKDSKVMDEIEENINHEM